LPDVETVRPDAKTGASRPTRTARPDAELTVGPAFHNIPAGRASPAAPGSIDAAVAAALPRSRLRPTG